MASFKVLSSCHALTQGHHKTRTSSHCPEPTSVALTIFPALCQSRRVCSHPSSHAISPRLPSSLTPPSHHSVIPSSGLAPRPLLGQLQSCILPEFYSIGLHISSCCCTFCASVICTVEIVEISALWKFRSGIMSQDQGERR